MGRKNITGVRKVTIGGKPRWFIDFRYTDKSGVRARYKRVASVQSFAAAVAEAKRLMALAAETGMVEQQPVVLVPRVQTLTFGAFADGPFEKQFIPSYREATAVRYRALRQQPHLAAFRMLHLDEIDTGRIREYAAQIQRNGYQTKPYITFIRTVLRAAVESGHLDALPEFPAGLMQSSKKLPDAPTRADVERMLKAPGWLGLAIYLAAFAGLRSGEVRAIEAQDIDLEQHRILIRRACSEDVVMTPKNDQERVVPLVPELEAVLRVAIKNKLPRARIVVDENGKTPTRQRLMHRFRCFLEREGIRHWTFHSLRHAFISELVRRGAGLEAVRLLAGHSKLEMTQRYAHANAADLRSAMAKLST